MNQLRIIQLPKIPDERGNLSFIEQERHVPFAIARAYWVYDVPGGESRDAHANRCNRELIVALSGAFEVAVTSPNGQEQIFTLLRADRGLYVPAGHWRELREFSTNAVALILASEPYDEADYIRNYEDFKDEQR